MSCSLITHQSRMASFSRLPSGLWRAQIFKHGNRQSATFETKGAAQQWATRVEADLDALKRGLLPRKTVAEALQKYSEEVSPKKKGRRWEQLRLVAYQREKWAALWLEDLHAPTLAAWRDTRLQGVTPGSVQRDVNLLRAVFTTARKEWRWLAHDPFEGFTNPGQNKPRTRRIQALEVWAICRRLRRAGGQSAEVARMFRIALKTGMRAGEILSLTPATVDLVNRVSYLTDTKNGEDRAVPMTRAAARLFVGWQGWTVDAENRDALFRKARKAAGLSGFTFHDSRAEALTRLARKVDVLTLARISGHRDLKILMQTYYRETAGQIAQRLG